MQLASQNPLLRTGCCLLGNFFARLAGPLPSKCTLTFAHSFAELLRNFADPSHQQGAHQRKSKQQGPWCLALAKPRFWKLGCCIWALFLETSEMDTNVNPKSNLSKLFTEQCLSRGLMLEPWKPSQLKTLTWTFRSTPSWGR